MSFFVRKKKKKERNFVSFSSRTRMVRCRPPLAPFGCRRWKPRPTQLSRPVVENAPFVLPINIRCNACSQYIYQGTHLVVYKEEVLDDVPYFFLSLSIFLFPRSICLPLLYLILVRFIIYFDRCEIHKIKKLSFSLYR